MPAVLFHIISRKEWASARAGAVLAPDSLRREGFIHLSARHQILRPANLLFSGRADLLLLVIRSDLLGGALVWEPGSHGEAEEFPHLYGSLDIGAVIGTVPFPCGPDGNFELPVDLDSVVEARRRDLDF